MNSDHAAHVTTIRERSHPLRPEPTDVPAVLGRLTEVRAVLFDVYGTLFISSSGEISVLDESVAAAAFEAAAEHAGLRLVTSAHDAVRRMKETIDRTHRELSRVRGEHPEVDIVRIWRSTLQELEVSGLIAGPVSDVDLAAFSVEYEVRANPVWPMPGAQRCLTELTERGLTVGLVSNGQWFSPLLFPALLGGCARTLGVPADLELWSYRAGEAKPGLTLFRQARAALAERGISASEALFVGNDMLFDIAPAAATGFRTALFAGDRRSLRLRQEDPRTHGLVPDLVLHNLVDIVRCVRPRR